MEDKRFRSMLDLCLKFREYEDEKLKIQLMQGSSSQNENLEEKLNALSVENMISHNI